MGEVHKRSCIVDYNKHVADVDGLDQMISYYPLTRKSLKWTKKVFYLMKISVHNAYVLYKAQSSTKKYKTMFKFVKYKTMFDEEVQNHEKHEEKASSYKKHEVRNHVKKKHVQIRASTC